MATERRNDLALQHENRTTSEPHVGVPRYFKYKPPVVRLIALLALVLLTPLMIILYLIVRLSSPGPGLFWQRRVGKDGKIFSVVKFRTMYKNAEKVTGPVWCTPQDRRITPVGRLYRFLHLDELPQLINVVRGEMCLIGPRPERPEIIERDGLSTEVSRYEERMRVLPGITGLAQINLPPDVSVNCVRRKVMLDLEYIETASIGLDLRILLCTALRMIGIRHGHAVKLLRLGRAVPDVRMTTHQDRKSSVTRRLFRPSNYLTKAKPSALLSSVYGNGESSSVVQLEAAPLECDATEDGVLTALKAPLPRHPR